MLDPTLDGLLSLLAQRWPGVEFSLQVQDGVTLSWRDGPPSLDEVPSLFGVYASRTLTWAGVTGELVDRLTVSGSLEGLDHWTLVSDCYVRSPAELDPLVWDRTEVTLGLFAAAGRPSKVEALARWLVEHWSEVCTLASARSSGAPIPPGTVPT